MARITVEDCLENVDSRFQLVLVAAKRARQLTNGSPTELAWGNDKATVLALREIADGLIGKEILEPAKPEPIFEAEAEAEAEVEEDDIQKEARAKLEAEFNAEIQAEVNTVVDTSEETSEVTESTDTSIDSQTGEDS
ncbi:MAG: DNA-directed RNA polymerase subunit omega [Gammaproteobacteria bacterium]|nr:DNA-directed RNA polymerase subunit omega [Gammaproteobacteria bacterium]